MAKTCARLSLIVDIALLPSFEHIATEWLQGKLMFTSQVAIVVCFKAFVCLSASFGRRYKGFECAFKGFERRFWDALSCYEFLAVLNVEASGQLGCLAVVDAGDAGDAAGGGCLSLY